MLTVWSVFALPGVILSGPIFLIASIMSKKKAKGQSSIVPFPDHSLTSHAEALAASSVKIAGRDVIASWKVLISLGLTPLLYTFYSILVCIILIRHNAPLSVAIWAPLYVFVSLPFIGYAALRFGEAGMDVLKSLRPLVIALIPGQQRSLDELKSMRVQLSKELMEISEEYGPKVFDDFNEVRFADCGSFDDGTE